MTQNSKYRLNNAAHEVFGQQIIYQTVIYDMGLEVSTKQRMKIVVWKTKKFRESRNNRNISKTEKAIFQL